MTSVPSALTGGLRSRRVTEALISVGTVDAIGMARPFVEFPDAARLILHGRADPIVLTPPSSTYGIHPVTWYQAQLRRQARGVRPAADQHRARGAVRAHPRPPGPGRTQSHAAIGMALIVTSTTHIRSRHSRLGYRVGVPHEVVRPSDGSVPGGRLRAGEPRAAGRSGRQ
jgi:hypothetical protein